MSDAMTSAITLKRRTVARNATNGLYYIFEFKDELNGFINVGRGYPHSTSCYAHLGRIVSKECR